MKAVAAMTGEKARRADRIERPRLRSFLEHKRSVADDSVPGPGRVTGIAQIEGARAQPMTACGLQEPANGHPTAGALLANVARLQGLDGFGGRGGEAGGGLGNLGGGGVGGGGG